MWRRVLFIHPAPTSLTRCLQLSPTHHQGLTSCDIWCRADFSIGPHSKLQIYLLDWPLNYATASQLDKDSNCTPLSQRLTHYISIIHWTMGPKKTTNPTNYISLVAHFLDFLTVSIHTILYERNVYPAESFISARKYNYPVRQSRHPDVCEWINDAINHIEKELMKCTIERISLVIFSRWDDPLERFVFDLSRFPVVNRQDWYTTFASDEDQGEKKLPVINMEEQFRAVMAKLAFCHRELE